MKPTFWPSAALRTAISPAQSGAEALVPLVGKGEGTPPKMIEQPLFGLELAATSGTPRPRCPSFTETGMLVSAWYEGRGNKSLTPPPEAPEPENPPNEKESFHAHSSQVVPLTLPIVVPPQASAQGSVAGYHTCARPSVALACAPLSPEQVQKVTPWIAASSKAADAAVSQPMLMPSASSVAASSPFDT